MTGGHTVQFPRQAGRESLSGTARERRKYQTRGRSNTSSVLFDGRSRPLKFAGRFVAARLVSSSWGALSGETAAPHYFLYGGGCCHVLKVPVVFVGDYSQYFNGMETAALCESPKRLGVISRRLRLVWRQQTQGNTDRPTVLCCLSLLAEAVKDWEALEVCAHGDVPPQLACHNL
jgi:hypothetical protein